MTSKRVRRRAGDILKISLGGGVQSYAQVAEEPLIVFFDGAWSEELPIDRVIGLPALFHIWVHNDAVKNGIWPVIGNRPLAPEHAAEPYFYKQDAVPGGCLSTILTSQIQAGSVLPQPRIVRD